MVILTSKIFLELFRRLGATLPIRRHPHGRLLLPAVWDLCGNVSAYHAVYVALTAALYARLVTRDAKLAKGAGYLIEIEFFWRSP